MNPLIYLRLLLAHRGHRRYSENAGFVMPLVILIGITLTLVGFAMMQRATSQKNDATSKEATAKALSAAEAGVTRIQNLINAPGSRILGTLPDCQNWNSGTNSCDDNATTDTASWGNLANLPNWTIEVPNGTAACQALTDIVTNEVNPIVQNRGWQSLTPGEGEYRLVGYTYDGTPGVAPGTGTLTIEGRDQGAASRVEVKIPITPSPEFVKASAMWVLEGVTSPSGDVSLSNNNEINANVLVNDCNVDIEDPASVSLSPGKEAIHVSQTMPELPDYPTSCPNTISSTISSPTYFPRRDTSGAFTDNQSTKTIGTGSSAQNLPAYVYCIERDINMTGGPNPDTAPAKTILVETIAQQAQTVAGGTDLSVGDRFLVIFYLKGIIDLQGNEKMLHTCSANCANYNPTDFNIFGYGTYLGPSVSEPYIMLTGTSSLDAFILAPDYVYGVNGGGGGTGVTGSLFIKGIDGGSNTSNIIFNEIPGQTWDDLFDGISPGLPSPLINAISGWTTKAVN